MNTILSAIPVNSPVSSLNTDTRCKGRPILILWESDYSTEDEFGTQTFNQGTTQNTYRYTGQQSDSDSGLLYLRARYYEPGTGRFLTRDPKEGNVEKPFTFNLYPYAKNNPINYTDPSGENAVVLTILVIGGFVVTVSGILCLEHMLAKHMGIKDKDIKTAMSALPDDCPPKEKAKIQKMLEKFKELYPSYTSPFCGWAAGDMTFGMSCYFPEFNFNLTKVGACNYSTATINYENSKGEKKTIDIYLYSGSDRRFGGDLIEVYNK